MLGRERSGRPTKATTNGAATARGRSSSSSSLLVALALLSWCSQTPTVLGLDCIQCDRSSLWYSPEENERHIGRCQRGQIAPSRCANATHTHCIYNFYRQGGVITITERRCGTADEVIGCTLYKSMRARRHLIAGSGTDVQPVLGWRNSPSHRRRETSPLVVEVCTGGCDKDGCVNGSSRRWTGGWTPSTTITLFVAMALVLQMARRTTLALGRFDNG